MTAPPRQLPLPFRHEPDYHHAAFLEDASNAAALAWLGNTAAWPAGRLAVWGEAGCGKTHLLHRWAGEQSGLYVSGAALRAWPDPLGPGAGGVAIDDADQAAEEPLLHLLNDCAEAGRPALLAAVTPPARWPIRLPDLASRLRAVTAVRIGPAEDALLRALLLRLLRERQLAVPEAVQEWLLRHLPRTPQAVREAAARLDRLALATGARVTRATALGVIESLAEDTGLHGDEINAHREVAPSLAGMPLL
ncbi:MAG: chromosomal replication initiator DnaA [Acetobacteraceae bacterium]|nr:chromosomal replication initiator DnaA [Acetobacteraceae bacterium]